MFPYLLFCRSFPNVETAGSEWDCCDMSPDGMIITLDDKITGVNNTVNKHYPVDLVFTTVGYMCPWSVLLQFGYGAWIACCMVLTALIDPFLSSMDLPFRQAHPSITSSVLCPIQRSRPLLVQCFTSSCSAFPSYISGVHHSSSSAFPSYISGVHHFG